jgi:hypothetical protein
LQDYFLVIILNDEKKEIGLKEITFHGHKITSDGVKVDDKKVNAIREIPTPTDVAGVKRLCGISQSVRAHTTWTVLLSLFVPSFFRTVVAHAKRILRAFRLVANALTSIHMTAK